MRINRRQFIKTCSAGIAGISFSSLQSISCTQKIHVPPYLKNYDNLYRNDPHIAAMQWFKDSKYGLFMHYGISSILGKGEWVQYNENIPLKEYIKLKDEFTAQNFDADFITDMALKAGMKYVNITSRHHDSFCLFESKASNYTSVNSPCKRDLVGELAEECNKKGLGLFLYYSYALDWWHPYFYPRKYNGIARPNYKNPDDVYKWRKDEDFNKYIEFVHTQLKELLTNYGSIAGIWFDPIMGYYGRPHLFPIEDTYAMIRRLQPQILISFKQGATGTEDFAAPERSGHSLEDRVRVNFGEESARIAKNAWERNKNKYNEICDTLQPGAWGYNKSDEGRHRSSKQVIQMLVSAVSNDYNLLLNTGPLPDGSIHKIDVNTLKHVGKWIDKNSESIYKTSGGPFKSNFLINSTFVQKNIYVHLKITHGKLNIPIDIGLIKSIQFLDGTILEYSAKNGNLFLDITGVENKLNCVLKINLTNEIRKENYSNQQIKIDIDAKYKSIELINNFSPKYSGQGTFTLQDGIRGDSDYNSGNWLGFEKDDFEAIIDLGKTKDLNHIEVGFLENQKSWIFFPTIITFYISKDKKEWEKVFQFKYHVKQREIPEIKNIIKDDINRFAQYVKIIAENIGVCPDWHPGKGGKAWVFIDEININ